MHEAEHPPLSSEELKTAISAETKAFESAYRWLEKQMPRSFFEAVDQETRILIARHLLSFALQGHFIPIYFKHKIIVLSSDAPDADLQVFKKYRSHVIRYYKAFVSKEPPPGEKKGKLRVSLLYFHDLSKGVKLPADKEKELLGLAREHNPNLKEEEVEGLIHGLTPNFLRSMAGERLALALEMFFRAKSREQCQYEVRRNENWEEKGAPSLQLVMAWRNVPKAGFLYHLAQVIHSHGLALQKVVGTFIDLTSTETILILSLGLHGGHGKAAWEEANIEDFLRELTLVKYFETEDQIGSVLVESRILTGNEGHLVRNFVSFVHQILVYADPNLYSYDYVMEGFCRHPELTAMLCKAFAAKFEPEKYDLAQFDALRKEFLLLVDRVGYGPSGQRLTAQKHLETGDEFHRIHPEDQLLPKQ